MTKEQVLAEARQRQRQQEEKLREIVRQIPGGNPDCGYRELMGQIEQWCSEVEAGLD